MDKKLLLTIISSSLIFSCSNAAINQNLNNPMAPTSSPSAMFVDGKIQSSDIEVTADDEFVLVLDGNATTGYQWVIDNYNKEDINFIVSKYENSSDNQAGSAGKYIFTFKALKPCNTSVLMKYLRPWEQGVDPIKTQTFNISVKSKNSSLFNLKFFNDFKKKIGL